ncbi:zinc finger protein-domain-containing protein [Aspergillus heterothallicus]
MSSKLPLQRIGGGACGTVWAASETGVAYKREDGSSHRSLFHDFETHQHILPANSTCNINIPLCHRFIAPTDAWWADNLDQFPLGDEPCNMIEMQRIPPVAESARKLLIQRYCPTSLVNEILRSETNRDCLIRPYLGRRRIRPTSAPSRFKAFSLRNYPLHLNQMEEIGIPEEDILGYSRKMADTLAFLHWVATRGTWFNTLGTHEMWMLDFDLAQPMTMDEQGIQQAASAFWGNDPYFPRPDEHSSIWKAFREQYIKESDSWISVTDSPTGQLKDLPRRFIDLVEEKPRRSETNLP